MTTLFKRRCSGRFDNDFDDDCARGTWGFWGRWVFLGVAIVVILVALTSLMYVPPSALRTSR